MRVSTKLVHKLILTYGEVNFIFFLFPLLEVFMEKIVKTDP